MFTESKIKLILNEIRKLPTETEWIEFKPASSIDLDRLGRYFSALSNEARLHHQDCGWIVFGVHNKTHDIVGTNYKDTPESLDKLKLEITQETTNGIGFLSVYELVETDKRVLMFAVPPAPYGMPIAWKNRFYGRDGSSLGDLKQDEIDRIRDLKKADWSAVMCDTATLDHLDRNAISMARQKYLEKFPEAKRAELTKEIKNWSDETFLKKIGMLNPDGKITRTAILLLGKPEAAYYLNPADAQISWVLFDDAGNKKDYEHFAPPYLVNVDRLFTKIRNLNYRYMPRNTLFPTEIQQYDSWVLREALNNSIAHQDYDLGGRVVVKEHSDHIICTNLGGFLADDVETFAEGNHVPDRYRNPWLCSAMFNLGMIDKVGSGISRMIEKQRRRFFPLPEWDIESEKVSVTVYGKILDENFTQLLIEKTDIDLKTVLALDKVQKRKAISNEDAKLLRSKKLIEGRKPRLFISANIAQLADSKIQYTKQKAFDDKYYEDLILSFITQHKIASPKELQNLLLGKLSDLLTPEQRRNKVRNITQKLSKSGVIKNTGKHGPGARWVLKNKTKLRIVF